MSMIDGGALLRALMGTPRGHDLLPPNLAAQLPPLRSTEGQGQDVLCRVKLFTPAGSWTWYLIEYDPDEQVAFAWVKSGLDPAYDELGYVSIAELDELNAAVERDHHYSPEPLRTVRPR